MADSFRLDDDGTITIEWAGTRAVTLRRPLFGEYEKLRQSLDEARTPPDPSDPTALDRTWPKIAAWWCDVIALLGPDGPPIETGDLPAWLPLGFEVERVALQEVAQTPFGRALAHWRSVPLARGETEETTTE